MSPRFSAAVVARNEEALMGDATARRLGSFPRLTAALTGHGFRRLWARRSVR
jgi:hypothetical protein